MADTSKEKSSNTPHWSRGGQIYYCDGQGFGVNSKGHTILIGKEEDLEKSLSTHQSTGNAIADKILALEIKGIIRGMKRARIAPKAPVVRKGRRRAIKGEDDYIKRREAFISNDSEKYKGKNEGATEKEKGKSKNA